MVLHHDNHYVVEPFSQERSTHDPGIRYAKGRACEDIGNQDDSYEQER